MNTFYEADKDHMYNSGKLAGIQDVMSYIIGFIETKEVSSMHGQQALNYVYRQINLRVLDLQDAIK